MIRSYFLYLSYFSFGSRLACLLCFLFTGFAARSAALGDSYNCEDVKAFEVGQCHTALSGGASIGNNSSGSLAENAANMSVASSAQSAYMQDANAFCETRKQRCQEWCAGRVPKTTTTQGSLTIETISSPATEALGKTCQQILAHGLLPKSLKCDGSPLVIQMGQEPITLTSPLDGIAFNLFGRNGDSTSALVHISWFDKKSRADSFLLTLPDDHGDILGIDQLFGNNTFGPDQKFAENGFEALKKYDGLIAPGIFDEAAVDGVIDARDPIFGRLRVWHDLNGNGLVDPGELVSLPTAGITSIDLNYTNFVEADQYGNTLRSRSIISLADGAMRVMFDLWFTL